MEEEEEVDMAEGEEVEIDVEEEEDLLYPLELEEGDWVVLLSELEESLEELHGGAGAVGGGSVVSAGVGGGRLGGSSVGTGGVIGGAVGGTGAVGGGVMEELELGILLMIKIEIF